MKNGKRLEDLAELSTSKRVLFERKLRKAAEMYKDTDLTISEVARECGVSWNSLRRYLNEKGISR